MAAGFLPKPGSKFGPCEDGCKHIDCNQTVRMALAYCHHCDKPIGYDVRFYKTDAGLVHAVCEEELIE